MVNSWPASMYCQGWGTCSIFRIAKRRLTAPPVARYGLHDLGREERRLGPLQEHFSSFSVILYISELLKIYASSESLLGHVFSQKTFVSTAAEWSKS